MRSLRVYARSDTVAAYLFAILFGLILADSVTTFLGIQYYGAAEKNPFVQEYFTEYGYTLGILLVTIIRVVSLVVLDFVLRKVSYTTSLRTLLYTIYIVAKTVVVSNNILVIVS